MYGRLRIYKNLLTKSKIEGTAFNGMLVCDCKCDAFYIEHTGKQTSGKFRPYLVKRKKQLTIVCRCKNCGKEFVIFDSTVDGVKPKNAEKCPQVAFAVNGKNIFGVSVLYNYIRENYLTDKFEDCFIYVTDEEGKTYVIYE